MPTFSTILLNAKQRLREAGIPSYALDAELLLAEALGLTREQVIFYPEREIASSAAYEALLTRRLNREPMAHILGRREFWGREFTVTADTLDPRPDSETLIETVLKLCPDRQKPYNILDLGTGTGCLLLTLIAEYTNACGVGVDISPAALAIAHQNAIKLSLAKRTQFLLECWTTGVTGTFDIIISNPPYIKASDIPELEPEVSRYEPYSALAGGDDGLECYRDIIPTLHPLLTPEGIVVFEFGKGQETDVGNLLRQHGFSVITEAKDLAGIIRCIAARRN